MSIDLPSLTQGQHAIGTRELVMLAILASLGGALSTFVGYLGNMINLALGVPFGAGQFMAGLHVFWIVLMRGLVRRNGAGTMGGLLKGLVELFTGSTHGIVIVIVSLIQGAVIDGTAMIAGRPNNTSVGSRIIWWIGAGISAAANVIVLQAFYYTGAPWIYITVISVLAFCSGVIFAGYFVWETMEFLNDTGVVPQTFPTLRQTLQGMTRRRLVVRNMPAILLVMFLTVGSAYYVTAVAKFFNGPNSCEVTGLVGSPYVFKTSDFVGQQLTIEAELVGSYIHLPPANYTGVLVSTILDAANPSSEATGLRVVARDGYVVLFDLSSVMSDNRMLLTVAEDGLWLIAAEYDGALWVKMVISLQIY